MILTFLLRRFNPGVANHYTTLAFNNAKEVFEHKSTKELFRSFFVLHICAIDPLVERSHKLMNLGERILGPTILSKILAPFYKQFVAGNSETEMANVVEKDLSRNNIHLMIAPVLETDIGDELGSEQELFKKNYRKTLHLIRLSSRCKPSSNRFRPVCQTKITAHISADVLTGIANVYDSLPATERLTLVQDIADIMKKSRKENISSLCKKLPFSELERKDLEESLPRLADIGNLCSDLKVILAIDAEYTYVNPAINLLSLSLMSAFNKDLPVIWNTYQGYLKNSKYWLSHDLEMTQLLKVSFGTKIVRGAYLEREKEYALINKLPCPINDSYEATNENYDGLINYLIPITAKSNGKCQVIAATHNEESVTNATQQMALHNIPKFSPNFQFAQIYGMAENITIPLSKAGFSVYKSVPYGNVNEVIPYLSRRANENRAVFRGARRERALLSQELLRRIKG